MRVAVVALAALVAPAASIEVADARVILRPLVVRECPQAKSWDAAVACMRKLGRPKLLRQIGNARLYSVNQEPDRSSETYLYVERRGTIQLAGLVREFDEESRFLGFARHRIANHTGYRIDFAEQRDVTNPTDGPSLFRRRVSVFCSGQSWRCSEVATSCELLVRGRARYTFRGKLVVEKTSTKDREEKTSVRLVGDRTNAGPDCTADEDVFLDWPMPGDDE